MKNREIRTIIGKVERRATEDGQIRLTGQPIVFNQKTDIGGWFSEEIAPEAIDDSVLRDVCFLVNHDFSGIPLARSRNNNANSNLRFTKTDAAVDMETDLDPRNPKAGELDSAIERGDIQGMSFAFIVDGEVWSNLDSDYPSRRITHISEIFEVSAVTWPAYEGTSIQSERSLESSLESLKRAREELESARVRSAKVAELNN
jgi:HK97 family phage prohead protease